MGYNSYGVESLQGRRNATVGAEKSQQCHKVLTSIKFICFQKTCLKHEGAKFASFPGRHLTSLGPCLCSKKQTRCTCVWRHKDAKEQRVDHVATRLPRL